MAEPPAARRSHPDSGEADDRRLLILGLGNPMMADDGIGHEVVRRLERCTLPKGVRLIAVDGDVLALMDMWQGETAVWLVDAVTSEQPAGSLYVLEHQALLQLPAGGLTTHHPSLSENLRWVLHVRPEMTAITFRLYGVEACVVRPERGLSCTVEEPVAQLVTEITNATRGGYSSPTAPLARARPIPTVSGTEPPRRKIL